MKSLQSTITQNSQDNPPIWHTMKTNSSLRGRIKHLRIYLWFSAIKRTLRASKNKRQERKKYWVKQDLFPQFSLLCLLFKTSSCQSN